MTNVRKHEPSRAHQHAISVMGFDCRDPNFRGPAQQRAPVLASRNTPSPPRLDERETALLRAREGQGRGLVRVLTPVTLVPFGLAGFGFDNAEAAIPCCDPHPTTAVPGLTVDTPGAELLVGEANEIEQTGITWPDLPALTDPIWVPALLIALTLLSLASLVTQWRNSPHRRTTGDRSMDAQLELPHLEKPSKRRKENAVKAAQVHSWRIEGATRTGKVRKENQDTFQIRRLSNTLSIAILNDGAGGVEGGREAAVTAANVLATELTADGDTPWIERLQQAIERTRQIFGWKKLGGLTTAIVMVFDGNWLHYATLGDGALTVVWPDGMVCDLLVPHHLLGHPSNLLTAYIGDGCAVPARIGSVRLEAGCSVMAMSDGASDLFPIEDYATTRKQYHPLIGTGDGALSTQFLEQLEEARDPSTGAYLHHDNMTLILAAYGNEEAQHDED